MLEARPTYMQCTMKKKGWSQNTRMIQTQVNAFQNPQLFFILHTYRAILMSKLWIGIIQKYNLKKKND